MATETSVLNSYVSFQSGGAALVSCMENEVDVKVLKNMGFGIKLGSNPSSFLSAEKKKT